MKMIDAVFAAVVAPFALSAGPAVAADQLHLYNWNNYIAPETIERFEQQCKCEVVQTYYSDNEELLAKLAAGAKGYDILVPTANAVQALVRGGHFIDFVRRAGEDHSTRPRPRAARTAGDCDRRP